MISEGKTCVRIARENHVGRAYVTRAADYAKGVDAAEVAVPGTKQKLLSGELKVSETAVSAVAKEPPEERKETVKEFSFVQKKRLPRIDYPSVGRPWEPKPKAENKPPDTSFAAARRTGIKKLTRELITYLKNFERG